MVNRPKLTLPIVLSDINDSDTKSEFNDGVKTSHYISIITNDISYLPSSKKDVLDVKKALIKEIDKIFQKTTESSFELLRPIRSGYIKKEIVLNRTVNLFFSTTLSGILITIGILAPYVQNLPHRYFWWSIAFPTVGVALATLYNLLMGK